MFVIYCNDEAIADFTNAKIAFETCREYQEIDKLNDYYVIEK